jgi:hypothetical protein
MDDRGEWGRDKGLRRGRNKYMYGMKKRKIRINEIFKRKQK